MTQGAFKPLLAETVEELSKLRFPVMASPKLDGIRCLVLDGKAVSRKLKPIPNDYIRTWIETNLRDGLDGELMLRDHRAPFAEVSSAIMSRGEVGEPVPDFVYNVFDLYSITDSLFPETRDVPFSERFEELKRWIGPGHANLQLVPHVRCADILALSSIIGQHLEQGYEGTMVRDPAGRYKFGRSTLKEGILLKIKPFRDEEATVVGVVEQMHNTNEATVNELGYTKRSSAKAGKVGAGKLGALVCVTEDGAEFEIGTGFTDAQRIELWRTQPDFFEYIGRQVKFKHQAPPGGRKPGEAPRFPVFLGWRED